VIVVPNKLFAGQDKATLRIVTQGKEPVSSFAYLAGPLTSKTMFVSDLPLLVETSGYGAGVNRDKNILGGEMKFFKSEDRVFAKGIGTNAAGALTESLLVIPLNQQYKRFKATVGIDAATGGEGTVRFRIGDGTKLLWDSKDMTYYNQPQEVDLDVSNSVVLLLWADDTGDGKRNDLANWAEARLELK
jgi:hypothetical protein